MFSVKKRKINVITAVVLTVIMIFSSISNMKSFAEENTTTENEETVENATMTDAEPEVTEEVTTENMEEDNSLLVGKADEITPQGMYTGASSRLFTASRTNWRDNWSFAGDMYGYSFKSRALEIVNSNPNYDCSSFVSAVLRANGEFGASESYTSAGFGNALISKGYVPLFSSPRDCVTNDGYYTRDVDDILGSIRNGDILVWYQQNDHTVTKHVSIGYIWDGWASTSKFGSNGYPETFESNEVLVIQSDGASSPYLSVESAALYLSGAHTNSYGSALQIYRKSPTHGTVNLKKITTSGNNKEGVKLALYKVSNDNGTYLNADKKTLNGSINLSGATDTAAADGGKITKIATITTNADGVGKPQLTTIINNAHTSARNSGNPMKDWWSITIDGNTIKGLPLADYIIVEEKSTTDSNIWNKGGTVSGINDVNGNAINTTLDSKTVISSWNVETSLTNYSNGVTNNTLWSLADMGLGNGQQFYCSFGVTNTFNSSGTNIGGRDISITVNNDDETHGLKLKKASSNPTLTNNNNCYSLKGAVYGVYKSRTSARDANESNYTTYSDYRVSLTTDASGNSTVYEPQSSDTVLYVKEIIAPKGYALDATVYEVDLTDSTKFVDDTYILNVSDVPKMDPIIVALNKKNSNGNAIAGAQYTIKFYEGEYALGVDPATLGKNANRTWVLKTDNNGEAKFDNEHKISGDGWYYNSLTNAIEFPLGTVTIQETLPPTNYLIDNTVYVRKITGDGATATVNTYNAPTIIETSEAKLQVKKASVEPTITLDSEYSLAGAIYAAYSNNTSATKANTNNYTTLSGYIGSFTTDEDGNTTKITGLNPGTYYVKEIKAPTNFQLDTKVYVADLTNPSIYTDNTYLVTSNEQPDVHIGTTASDISTGDDVACVNKNVTIKDIISFKGLEVGKEYTIKGVLMDKSTGEPLLINGAEITAEKTFAPAASVGTVEIEFPAFDSKNLDGKSVVVFEKMYRNNNEVASHADINDDFQTVKFPKMRTTAADIETGDNISNPDEEVNIVDKVQCTNLVIGKSYTIKGVLMDKSTGEPLLINGAEITAEKTFTAEEVNCIVNVEFPAFDGSALIGKSIVVFEDMYHNDKKITTHSELTDEGQTVVFPELHTTAKDAVSGSHTAQPSESYSIIDTVEYNNLIPGKEYTIKGILMNAATGEALRTADGSKITAEKTFSASASSGSVDMLYEFNGVDINDISTVVFEDLYYNDIKIATHSDLTDEGQTVYIDYTKLYISKLDATTKAEISGAELSLYNDQNVLIEKWISNGEPHYIKSLMPGDYKLVEVTAPNGYEIAQSVNFTLVKSGEKQTAVIEDDVITGSAHITKADDRFKDKKLSGVTFMLFKTKDTIIDTSIDAYLIDTWNGFSKATIEEIADKKKDADDLYVGMYTTDDDGNIYVDKLVAGKYYFVEVSTQRGYILNSDSADFEIDSEHLNADIEILNTGRVGTITYNSTYVGSPSERGIPRTGDNFKPTLAIVVLILSFLAAVILIVLRRKKINKKLFIIPLFFGLSVCMFFPNTSMAKENDSDTYTETKEGEYDTDDKSKYNLGFEQEVKKDDKTYKLDGISYDIKSDYDNLEKKPEEELTIEEKNVLPDYIPEKNITKKGFKYELDDYEISVLEYESVDVTYSVDSEYLTYEPEHKSSVSYDYTYDKTGEKFTVELPYVSSEIIESGYCIPIEIKGTIKDYNAEYIIYNGTQIVNPQDDLGSMEGLLKQFVVSSGYMEDDYRNLSYSYDGPAYTDSNGIVCRDYTIKFDIYGNKYRFHYAATFDNLTGSHKAMVKYVLSNDAKTSLEDMKNHFTVTGTAVYKVAKQNKKTSFFSTTAGKVTLSAIIIIGLMIFISLLIYLIKGGRKDTDYKSRRDAKRDYKNL